jgi:hypothetical protein
MNKIKIAAITIALYIYNTSSAFAQNNRPNVGELDPGERFGGGGGSITINLILDRFINFALGSAATVFVLIFVWGAFTWLTSQGDKAAVESAKAKITSGAIGFIIIASAWAVFTIVREITFPAPVGP